MKRTANYTKAATPKDIKRTVRVIDARDVSLGRLASGISVILQGKDKSYMSYEADVGDYVVVTNIQFVRITGAKASQKEYGTYSGYPGGLRLESLASLLQRNPRELIRRAVKGMLPKNKLRDKRLARLSTFVDENYKTPVVGLPIVIEHGSNKTKN
ncbi:MAG: 50S ribosomal protein L13 [Candidatus Roizmanbacteria bacterium]|nr:50S ribosomal protein L13 [Candidatus Roizmanbacteria bacterium]